MTDNDAHVNSGSGTQIPAAGSGTQVPPTSGTQVPPTSGTQVPPSGSGTQVPPGSGTAVPPGSGTAVPLGSAQQNQGPATAFDFTQITINGNTYVKDALISDQSGEARLYRVVSGGKKYAFKLYNLNRRPHHDVLKSVQQMPRNNGLVVDLYEEGVWNAPDGNSYDYELMRYCSGGSLADLKPLCREKDGEDRLCKIAVQMAAEIDFCHQHKVLHRDIKPANFLYEDETRTNFVMTDFGIGKIIGNDGQAIVDVGRTPIYAAPETYANVPGVTPHATPAADFYSMGMSLLVLWMGETPFNVVSEEKLFHDKQREQLPYPTEREMSKHTLSLLKSLTRFFEEKRATYVDIERWATGEDVFNAEKAEFTVPFSSSLTAHSPAELGQIMWANQKLAKEYLYQEQIEKMLRETKYPELAVQIHTITERYARPAQRDAGLFAACLLFDENMVYEGLHKNRVETKEEIAEELTLNEQHYVNALTNKDHPLWVYIESCGNGDISKKYPAIIQKTKVYGLRMLTYQLDPRLPFRTQLREADFFPGSKNRQVTVSSLDDLFKQLHEGVFNDRDVTALLLGEDKLETSDIATLTRDDFLQWLAGKNPVLAKNAENMLMSAPSGLTNEDLGWRTAYTIAADRGYDFLPLQGANKTQLGTIEDIARQMAREINDGKATASSLTGQMTNVVFRKSRLYQYLTTKKIYAKHISYIEYCMDTTSDDNRRKSGPYNDDIAQMKAVAGMLPGRTFPLTLGGLTLNTLADYEKNRDKVNAAARSTGKIELLQNWLTLQFQEKPGADMSGGNYTKTTMDYLRCLMDNLPDCEAAQKGAATESHIEYAKHEFHSSLGRVSFFKGLAIVLGYLPLLAVCGFIIYNLIFNVDSDSFRGVMESIGNVLGWIVGIGGGLVLMAAITPLGGIIAGVLLYYLTHWLIGLLTPLVPWLLVLILVIIIIVSWLLTFSDTKFSLHDRWANFDLDNAAKLAILGDAFDKRQRVLYADPPLPDDYPACVYSSSAETVKSGYRGLIGGTVVLIIVAAIVMALFVWAGGLNVALGNNEEDTEMPIVTPEVAGSYTGTFDGRKAEMQLYKADDGSIQGTVTIHYRKTLKHQVLGYFSATQPNYLTLMVVTNGEPDNDVWYAGSVESYDSGVQEYAGSYTNRHKGTSHAFVFTQE